MEVKTAFLNGELEEEVYMIQSEGSMVSGQEKYASSKITVWVEASI